MGIPICDLIENYVVALYLAMWISPSFAIVVMDWTSRFISGDLALVHDLVDRHESVNVGTRVKATVTTADAAIDPDVHERLHQDNATIDQLKVRIAKVIQDAETGEAKLVQQLRHAEAHGGKLEEALLVEQECCEGLVAELGKAEVRGVDLEEELLVGVVVKVSSENGVVL